MDADGEDLLLIFQAHPYTRVLPNEWPKRPEI